MTRIALDSNVLVYLAGIARIPADQPKVEEVRRLIRRLSEKTDLVVPIQALGELFTVLRRTGVEPGDARDMLLRFTDAFTSVGTGLSTMLSAVDLVVDYKLQTWDAVIIATAAEANCSLLLSEDMQHGFVTRGVTVVNPLLEDRHPRLAALLPVRG